MAYILKVLKTTQTFSVIFQAIYRSHLTFDTLLAMEYSFFPVKNRAL